MTPRLNRQLVLEERQAAEDGAGGLTEAWVEVGLHYVALTAQSGREGSLGLRPNSRVTHKALLRYAPLSSPERPRADQRFREESRVFAIHAIAEADDRRGYLVCWLEEGAMS
jgi:head-tail adaptor